MLSHFQHLKCSFIQGDNGNLLAIKMLTDTIGPVARMGSVLRLIMVAGALLTLANSKMIRHSEIVVQKP